MLAPQTLALVAALALLIAGGWYLMRPESADALYARIEAAATDGDIDTLKAVRRDMDAFLERYPDDPRADQVRGYEEEVQQSSPIQRAFAEAKRYVLVSPEQALVRFQALIDVYDDGPNNNEITKHYVRLAKLQRNRLQKRVDAYVADGRTAIETRLDKAAELATDRSGRGP